MKKPLFYRHQIPFFHDKTATAFRQDKYERYDPVVIRQTSLHLADELSQGYPFQKVLDWVNDHLPELDGGRVVDIGCGVGRLIGNIAEGHAVECWGIDYSYQLLRRAREYWVEGKAIQLDREGQGLGTCTLSGKQLANLSFGLARAEALPFEADSQALVCSSFLLDRVKEPERALAEMYRVLRPGGRMILVTPLNFQQAAHWAAYYPLEKLLEFIRNKGFRILNWQEDLTVEEPLDGRGNFISWKVLALVAEKD